MHSHRQPFADAGPLGTHVQPLIARVQPRLPGQSDKQMGERQAIGITAGKHLLRATIRHRIVANTQCTRATHRFVQAQEAGARPHLARRVAGHEVVHLRGDQQQWIDAGRCGHISCRQQFPTIHHQGWQAVEIKRRRA